MDVANTHRLREYNNVEKFEIFRKEVFRVPSKDRNCTVTANAQKEYLQSSDVEAWLCY